MSAALSVETSPSLLERLRQPADPDAWNRFVHLYSPLLHLWARRLHFSAEDAADRVQDVFLLLAGKLPEFRPDRRGCFRGWLWTVFLNRCREHVRRRPDVLVAAARPQLDRLACADDPAAWVEADYRQHVVGQALAVMRAEFPETTWRAVWESVACGRPPAEVAAELGIKVGAVYVARSRVLGRLRQELRGLLD